MLLVCEAIYGVERGIEVRAMVEGATGEACPCRQGRPCPLMPTAAHVTR
jgi:hypothetical protein